MSAYKQKTAKWKFGKECTIYEASDLHEKFRDILEKAPTVTLDVSAIEQVDASFIQLLASAHIEAFQSDVQIKISGESEPLNQLAESIYCQSVLDSEGFKSALEVQNNES